MQTPDFKKLQAAANELQELTDQGRLTKTEFTRLLSVAKEAVGPETRLLEGFVMNGLRAGYLSLT